MKRIEIQGVGQLVSSIGLGGLRLGSDSREASFSLLDCYLALGGNLIDTAEAYGRGSSERVIGEYLRQRQNRAAWVILTKGCVSPELVRPSIIERAIQGSLSRLGVESIDLYLLHRDDPVVPVGELVDVLNRAQRKGELKSFGVSNWSVDRLAAANEYARNSGLSPMACSSPHVGLAIPKEPFWSHCTHASDADLQWYRRHQVPVIAWSAACRGFFADDSAPDNFSNPDLVRVYHSPENFERLARARRLALELGTNASSISVAFALHSGPKTIAVVGPRTTDELAQSMEAANLALDDAQLVWLRSVAPQVH